MKYVGILNNDVIIAKAKIYEDFVDERHIELSEEQYNTIITPCRLIDGVFVPCDFPKLDEFEDDTISRTKLVSYVGTGKSGASYPCSVTFDFVPKVIVLMGEYYSSGGSLPALITQSLVNDSYNSYVSNVTILCDKLSSEYENFMGFWTRCNFDNSRNAYAKKSEDGKTISWYISEKDSGVVQANRAGATYYVLGIG